MRVSKRFIGIFLACLVIVALFLSLHHLNILFKIEGIYIGILTVLLGAFLVLLGIGYQRQTRQEGRVLPWRKNLFFIFAIGIILNMLSLNSRMWDRDLVGPDGVVVPTTIWGVNLSESVLVASLVLLPLLFEVWLTDGCIRFLLQARRSASERIEDEPAGE